MIYLIILIIMTLLGSFASFFLKKASGTSSMAEIITNLNLYIGGTLYVISAVLNIYVLKFLDYSIVLPLTSLTYVWTMFVSKFFLNEKLTEKKIIGVSLIVIGATVISILG